MGKNQSKEELHSKKEQNKEEVHSMEEDHNEEGHITEEDHNTEENHSEDDYGTEENHSTEENYSTEEDDTEEQHGEEAKHHELIWKLKCFPLVKKTQVWVERGGKLLLPEDVLNVLVKEDTPGPFTFRVTNPSKKIFTHAGVLEFTAKNGEVNLPAWMMGNLGVKSGETLNLELVSLPTANFCRLEPLTRNFAYVSDTKTVLEHQLRYFGCITEGDILNIYERGKMQMYKLRVMETKPGSAVKIFDCEMELDVVVPKKPEQRLPTNDKRLQTKTLQFESFQGRGYSLHTQETESMEPKNEAETKKRARNEEEDCVQPPKKKFCVDEQSARLLLIRHKQKEFLKKQESERFSPFSGPGNILKRPQSAENTSECAMELDEAAQKNNTTEIDNPQQAEITEVERSENGSSEPTRMINTEEEVNLTELVFIRPKQQEATKKQTEND